MKHSICILTLISGISALVAMPGKSLYKPVPKQQQYVKPAVRICWLRRESFYKQHPEIDVINKNNTVSVIIPCYYKHAPLLYSLLALYEQQTRLPDEVVISLSQAHLVDAQVIENIENRQWAFPVKLIMTDEKKYAGENRNIACEHATGSIFMCQDADDIPHPQRVEIITHFFDNYPVDHLFHQLVEVLPEGTETSFGEYNNLEYISFAYHKNFDELWHYGQFTNGNVAIARHVFDTVRWSSQPRGQDTLFNDEVYKHFEHGIAIQAVLLGYRRYLSSESEAKI